MHRSSQHPANDFMEMTLSSRRTRQQIARGKSIDRCNRFRQSAGGETRETGGLKRANSTVPSSLSVVANVSALFLQQAGSFRPALARDKLDLLLVGRLHSGHSPQTQPTISRIPCQRKISRSFSAVLPFCRSCRAQSWPFRRCTAPAFQSCMGVGRGGMANTRFGVGGYWNNRMGASLRPRSPLPHERVEKHSLPFRIWLRSLQKRWNQLIKSYLRTVVAAPGAGARVAWLMASNF
jgi:hypothetical protein